MFRFLWILLQAFLHLSNVFWCPNSFRIVSFVFATIRYHFATSLCILYFAGYLAKTPPFLNSYANSSAYALDELCFVVNATMNMRCFNLRNYLYFNWSLNTSAPLTHSNLMTPQRTWDTVWGRWSCAEMGQQQILASTSSFPALSVMGSSNVQ